MGTDVAEVEKTPDSSRDAKVHRFMCTQLRELIDRILKIFPHIEAARPWCKSGIETLCLLRLAIDKAKLLLQNCSESSRLYLAITGDAIVTRFEKTRKQLEQSLRVLQTMVSMILELQISQIVDDLSRIIFIMDSSEQKAGKVLVAILQKHESVLTSFGNSEIRALRFVASRIHLSSQKDLLIEKRSIMNMLDKVSDSKQRKKTTLKYLHYLLEKHDMLVLEGQTYYFSMEQDGSFSSVNGHSVDTRHRLRSVQDEVQPGIPSTPVLPEEFKCSLAGIQLQIDLSHLSLGSDDLSPTLDRSEVEATLLSNISLLPWESQCTAIKDVQNYLDYYSDPCVSISLKNFVEPVAGFLKDAVHREDVRAQITGTRLLLTGLQARRCLIQCINEEVYHLMTSFLGTVMTKDVLAMLELLSLESVCRMKLVESGALTSILEILDTQNKEFHELAIRILYNLSFYEDPRSVGFLPLESIQKLVPFLRDSSLCGLCIVILEKQLCTEEARVLAVETDGCIAAIVELLETGNCKEQEHGLSVLLSLCSLYSECCKLALEEGVLQTLFCIRLSGNERGKVYASDLVRLLRDIIDEEEEEEAGAVPEKFSGGGGAAREQGRGGVAKFFHCTVKKFWPGAGATAPPCLPFPPPLGRRIRCPRWIRHLRAMCWEFLFQSNLCSDTTVKGQKSGKTILRFFV